MATEELRPNEFMATCAVCELVDGDYSVKACTYCGLCGKNICRKDKYAPLRRLKAAGINAVKG